MKKPLLFFALLLIAGIPLFGQEFIIWNLARTDSIGSYPASILYRAPKINGSEFGDVLEFNGIDEALLIDVNPIGDASEFTIEIIFKPDSSFNSANKEQRFIHIRNGSDDDRRILLELRLYPNQKWALDTFIKSENSRCALLDSNISHPAGLWYTAALVYKSGLMTHYVNAIQEMSGEVDYEPIIDGKISIGARQDPRNWFKGSIKTIRFTKHALKPEEFLKVN